MAANGKTRESVIAVRGLKVGFGEKLVLDGVDLDVYRGEILGFVGGSGAGKSVLMRTVIGLLPSLSRRRRELVPEPGDVDWLDDPEAVAKLERDAQSLLP